MRHAKPFALGPYMLLRFDVGCFPNVTSCLTVQDPAQCRCFGIPIFRNAPETSLKTLADRCGFGDELTRLSKNINVMGVQAARKN